MSQLIELPDPLYSEINEYALQAATSPLYVIQQAWKEFRHRQEPMDLLKQHPRREELLDLIVSLRGSISLPPDVDDKTLIAQARMEKYGPL